MPEQVFETNEEMSELVQRLCDERTDLFPKVQPVMIACALRIDKPAPANAKGILKIKGIRGPLTALTDKRYLIYGYQSQWQILSREQKIAHLAFALKHVSVPSDDEEAKLTSKGKKWEWGKLEKPDFLSFKSFARVLGVDWEENPELPNLLEDVAVVV